MLGAIIGDIVGSPYEFGSDKEKDFPLFVGGCRMTDDSLMTMAVGCACVTADLTSEADFKRAVVRQMREIGRQYPNAGYGAMFYDFLMSEDDTPCGSNGNGAAMRVSPVAWAARSLDEAETLAAWSAEVTHDHPDGICGAQAVAAAIYLARTGASKAEIRAYVEQNYYALDFTLDAIRPTYRPNLSCKGSVPQAIVCFLEAEDFEDALRNAVSLGGDVDTQAAIAGSIAEAFFEIPNALADEAMAYIEDEQMDYYLAYADELYG